MKLKPTVIYRGTAHNLKTEDAIKQLIHEVYGVSRPLAGFVESFVDPRRHIRTQKHILREFIDSLPYLKKLKIKITAGIHNYENYEYIRVDGNTHVRTAVDEIHKIAAKDYARLPEDSPLRTQRVAKQAPEVILFHHSSIHDARKTAREAVGGKSKTLAGSVFAFSTSNVHPLEPLDIYKVLGIYYAVLHFRPKHLMIMGNTLEETKNMKDRLFNDPMFQAVQQILDSKQIKMKKVMFVPGRKRLISVKTP